MRTHSPFGFPSTATHGTWYEDRDTADKRYGHRSGTHSDPIAGGGDEYTKGGVRDQANGDQYSGRDSPGGPSSITGQYLFKLAVIDTCNGNREKATSPVITINWFPSAVEIPAGEEHRIEFDVGDGEWEPADVVQRLGEGGAQLAAVYEIAPTPESDEQQVWTGRVQSPFVSPS